MARTLNMQIFLLEQPVNSMIPCNFVKVHMLIPMVITSLYNVVNYSLQQQAICTSQIRCCLISPGSTFMKRVNKGKENLVV